MFALRETLRRGSCFPGQSFLRCLVVPVPNIQTIHLGNQVCLICCLPGVDSVCFPDGQDVQLFGLSGWGPYLKWAFDGLGYLHGLHMSESRLSAEALASLGKAEGPDGICGCPDPSCCRPTLSSPPEFSLLLVRTSLGPRFWSAATATMEKWQTTYEKLLGRRPPRGLLVQTFLNHVFENLWESVALG